MSSSNAPIIADGSNEGRRTQLNPAAAPFVPFSTRTLPLHVQAQAHSNPAAAPSVPNWPHPLPLHVQAHTKPSTQLHHTEFMANKPTLAQMWTYEFLRTVVGCPEMLARYEAGFVVDPASLRVFSSLKALETPSMELMTDEQLWRGIQRLRITRDSRGNGTSARSRTTSSGTVASSAGTLTTDPGPTSNSCTKPTGSYQFPRGPTLPIQAVLLLLPPANPPTATPSSPSDHPVGPLASQAPTSISSSLSPGGLGVAVLVSWMEEVLHSSCLTPRS
ncbi:Uu.00g055320.m01.CDS01 [Anthostomella pinea]|uniref:Uu.00g055320.m01.CDS01 n=1 Tax=Anthostomella pinea TaxID=933095 RepID=A0AAI8VWR6_9PEZI|nr:Uu.00g055320.m01.CDS01 [Anthostomella pinea]